MNVSYAMCERVVKRDAHIRHFVRFGWWRVFLEGRCFQGQTRSAAIGEAATDLQRRLEADLRTNYDLPT